MIEIRGYPIHVFWSDEDAAFVATAPDLPGCSAVGRTRHDAAREIEDAIAAWLQAALTVGNPVPQPGTGGRIVAGS